MNRIKEQLQDQRISKALNAGQLVEECLRTYIEKSYFLIQLLTKNNVPFRFHIDDHKKDSLGRLIEVFSKLNENAVLQKRLKEFVVVRNFVAHKVFSEIQDAEEENQNGKNLEEINTELEDTYNEGCQIAEFIIKETGNLKDPSSMQMNDEFANNRQKFQSGSEGH